MKFRLLFFVSVFLLITPSNLSAQSNRQYSRAADEAMANGDYTSAIVYLRHIIDNDSTILEIDYKYAEACRLSMDYKTAERWYAIINLKDKGGKQFPDCAFWLGMVSTKKQRGYSKDIQRNSRRLIIIIRGKQRMK